MTHIHQSKQQEQGFTLVELSIVLVIIGLIVGGILVGQDMIKAAEIRSTVSQIGSLNAAMNTFRDKYQFLPGDINADAAAAAGMTARGGGMGSGDGNSMIDGFGTTTPTTFVSIVGGETALVWRDLNFVGMLDGSFVTATDAQANPGAALGTDGVKQFLPEARLGRGNYITVYASQGYNFYQITGITQIAAGAPTLTAALTPQETLNLDQKTDDGVPLTGTSRAQAVAGTALNVAATAAVPAAAVCVSNVTGNPYNTTTEAFANAPACGLRVRMN